MRGLPDHPRGGAGPKGAPSPAILGSQPYARSPWRLRAFTGFCRLSPALPCLTGAADPSATWWCTARRRGAGRCGISRGTSGGGSGPPRACWGFGNPGRQPVPRAHMTGRGRATGARPAPAHRERGRATGARAAPAHRERIRRYSRLPASAGFDGYSRVSACLIDLVDRFLVAVPGTHDGGDAGPEQLCAGGAEASKVLTGRPAVRARRGSLGGLAPRMGPGAAAGLGGCFVCSRRPPGSCWFPPQFRHGLCPAVNGR
jgi:hypothetical protein